MKKQKSEVDYSPGHHDSHCGPWSKGDVGACAHFVPHAAGTYRLGTCTRVAGPINPRYWCKEWERTK